ncbi:MAG: hypothetical protein KatS3mg111_0184 [Pirellulaceae bacterium]|nr:MAG: hypothetical protein KatS3mg111_0184 [Pirellulaceae bacterium]
MMWHRLVTHWNPYDGRHLVWKLLVLVGAGYVLRHERAARWWLVGMPTLSTLVAMALYTVGGRFLVPCYGALYTLGGLGAAASMLALLRLAIDHQTDQAPPSTDAMPFPTTHEE